MLVFCGLALPLKSKEHLGYGPECSEALGEGGEVGRSFGDLNQNYIYCSTAVLSVTKPVIYVYCFCVS